MGEKENADVIFPVHFQIFVLFVFLSPNATGEIPTTTQQPFKIPGFRVLFMKYLLCVSVTTLNPYPFRRSYPPDVSYGIENNDHSLGKLIPTRIVGPQKT